MQVGFVTDTHLGLHSESGNREVRETYKRILNEFESRDVQSVVHLGDCIDERTNKSPLDLIDFMKEQLERFDSSYITPGNHDVLALNKSDFTQEELNLPPESVDISQQETLVFLDTAMESEYKNVGYISDESLNLLQQELERGREIIAVSHYPIDYTNFGSEVFNFVPESAYPVNKIDVKGMQENTNGSVRRIFCGHLHPEQTSSETTPLLVSNETIIEPVTDMRLDGDELSIGINSDIEVDDLIFEI